MALRHPEVRRRLTCAEQPDILKLGIILISGQTVQKPRGAVLVQFEAGSSEFSL